MTKRGKQAILAVVFITLKLFEMCDNYAGLFTNFSQIQKKSKDDFDFTKKLYFLFVFISNFFSERVQLYRNEYCVSSFSYQAVETMI